MKSQKLSLASLLVFAASVAYGEGTIVGVARHEPSGEPFEGVLVAVNAPQYYGRHPTDSRGAFRLEDVPIGTWQIEFHCPSANYVGREIDTRSVTVRSGKVSSVDVQVPLGHCYEPPYSEVESEFRGYVSFGFEHSSFVPCAPESLNLSRNSFLGTNSIWVRFRTDRGALRSDTLYFAVLRGTLKGPGRFGHLGVSAYELEVQEIEKTFEVNGQDCERHARDAA
jgi:hypothetical protein